MNPSPQAQSAPDARLAGGMINIVQQLQKNRFGGIRRLQGAPVGGETSAAEGAEVLNAIRNSQQNEQGQNAPGATGTFQEQGGQAPRRPPNVGQGEAQSSFRQGSQVSRPEEEEEQQRKRMR